jgi:hypothetical protein
MSLLNNNGKNTKKGGKAAKSTTVNGKVAIKPTAASAPKKIMKTGGSRGS